MWGMGRGGWGREGALERKTEAYKYYEVGNGQRKVDFS